MNTKKNANEMRYRLLLESILDVGIVQPSRAGDVIMLPNMHLDINLECNPLITGKKIFYKTAYEEFKLLYLQGVNNINDLKAAGINYWDKFAKDETGDLGPIYGVQWRNFNGVDQVEELITGIIKDPLSRRHIVSAWNVAELKQMALPPCPVMFQVNIVDNKIYMQVTQRSADLFLGVPFDIYQHYLMCLWIQSEVFKRTGIKYELGMLSFSYGNAHIYLNHMQQVIQYLDTETFEAPEHTDIETGEVKGYMCGPYIKGEINN